MKKTIIISSIIVGVVAIVSIVLYALYPIERPRPDDINEEFWTDTKRLYIEVTYEVDQTMKGKDLVGSPVALDEWTNKYINLVPEISLEGTPHERQLAKAMYDMSMSALVLQRDFAAKKAGLNPDIAQAKADYEKDKKAVENILYIWK